MESRELCEIALRVLKAWTYKELPALTDIDLLRQSCLADEADVPIDELACRIIGRECQKVMRDSRVERKSIASNIVHPRKKAS